MKNKIKFNLELYNSGEYDVVTREGVPVRIAGANKEASKYCQLLGWDKGAAFSWSINGKFRDEYESDLDIFLIPKKKIIKGWANVYQYNDNALVFSGNIRETKEDAIKAQGHNAIGVVYIETELIPNK